MRGLFVEGMGVVGPFGVGRESFDSFLSTEVPNMAELNFRGTIPEKMAQDLAPSPKRMRRQDWFSLLALASTKLAVEDAGLTDISGVGTALLLVSSRGPARTVTGFFRSLPESGEVIIGSPSLFVQSLPNNAAAKLCLEWAIEGQSYSISAPCGGLLRQIQNAEALLNSADTKRVILCVVEETLGPILEDDNKRVHPSLEVGTEGAITFLFSNKVCTGRTFFDFINLSKTKKTMLIGGTSYLESSYALGFATHYAERKIQTNEELAISFVDENCNGLLLKNIE